MLAYRHAYHAGNHADVLKHVVLVQLLDYLRAKDRPFWYIDTHCGAGGYRLDDGPAARRSEYRDGIARVRELAGPPPALTRYLGLVADYNGGDRLGRYPGSAWFAARILGPEDRLWLCELHPSDHAELTDRFANDRDRVHVLHEDGFAALRRLLPPAPRRSLVLIDPSYELASDYAAVVEALADALRRFPTGTYALWYPMLRRREADRLPRQLGGLAPRSWLHARLAVRRRPVDGYGLYGSGLYVANPPYTLPATLEGVLPALAAALGQDAAAAHTLDFEIP